MNLSLILTFIEVVKKGSLSKAATHLSISIASVSRHIDELEHQLNTQLFIRSTRKLDLTDAGTVFYDKIKSLPMTISEAQAAVENIQNEIAGELRIILTPVDFFNLAPYLKAFCKLYPKLKLKFVEYTVNTLKQSNLISNLESYDILILPYYPDIFSNFSHLRMSYQYTYCLHWCASIKYLEEHGEPETLEELQRHYIIARQTDYDHHFKNLFQDSKSVEFNRDAINLIIGSVIGVYGCIMEDHGIGMLPKMIIESRSETLKLIMPSIKMVLRPSYVLRQDILKPTKKVEVFIDFIKGLFK